MERVRFVFGNRYLDRALAYLIHSHRDIESMRLVSVSFGHQTDQLIVSFTENYANLKDIRYIAEMFKKHVPTHTNRGQLVADLLAIRNTPTDASRYINVPFDCDIIRRPVPERAPYVVPFVETVRDIHYENWVRLVLYYIDINDVTRAISVAQFLFIVSGAWNPVEHKRLFSPFTVKKNVDLKAQYRFAFDCKNTVSDDAVDRLRSPFGVLCVEIVRKFPWTSNVAFFMLHSMSSKVMLMCIHAICLFEHDQIVFSSPKPRTALARVECTDIDILRSLPSVAASGYRPLEFGFSHNLVRLIDAKFRDVDTAELTTLKRDLVPRVSFDKDYQIRLSMWREGFGQIWDESYNLYVGIGQSDVIEVKYMPMDSSEYLALTSEITSKLTGKNSRVHWFVDPSNQRLAWYGPLTRYPNTLVAKITIFKTIGATVPQFTIYRRNQCDFFMVSSPNMLPETDDPYPMMDKSRLCLIDKKKAGMVVLADLEIDGMVEVFSSKEVLTALLMFWTLGLHLPKGDDIVKNPHDGKWYILGFHKQGYFPNSLGTSSTLYQLLFRSSHGERFAAKVTAALARYSKEVREIADMIDENISLIRDVFIKYGCAQHLPSDMNERVLSIKACVFS